MPFNQQSYSILLQAQQLREMMSLIIAICSILKNLKLFQLPIRNLTVENGTVSESIFAELNDTTTGIVTVNEDTTGDDGTTDD